MLPYRTLCGPAYDTSPPRLPPIPSPGLAHIATNEPFQGVPIKQTFSPALEGKLQVIEDCREHHVESHAVALIQGGPIYETHLENPGHLGILGDSHPEILAVALPAMRSGES